MGNETTTPRSKTLKRVAAITATLRSNVLGDKRKHESIPLWFTKETGGRNPSFSLGLMFQELSLSPLFTDHSSGRFLSLSPMSRSPMSLSPMSLSPMSLSPIFPSPEQERPVDSPLRPEITQIYDSSASSEEAASSVSSRMITRPSVIIPVPKKVRCKKCFVDFNKPPNYRGTNYRCIRCMVNSRKSTTFRREPQVKRQRTMGDLRAYRLHGQ